MYINPEEDLGNGLGMLVFRSPETKISHNMTVFNESFSFSYFSFWSSYGGINKKYVKAI
jgi:hypothetical protein